MHLKYYKVADIPIEVRSALPITENTFHPKFQPFEADGPGGDMVVIHHHFSGIPDIKVDVSERIYFRPPWAIYRMGEKWVYQWIESAPPYRNYYRTVVTDKEHSHLDIFNDDAMRENFLAGGLTSLAMFPTDQIVLGRLLAYRSGCIMHSLGIILNGNGYLFIGHSSAGKSTMAQILKKEAVILCDDRNIIRKLDDRLMVYGTWSHGDVPDISPLSAPLKGLFFLEKSDSNELISVKEKSDSVKILLACLIRPLATGDWWDLSMNLISDVVAMAPCWILKFDKSGGILGPLLNYNANVTRGV